MRIIRLSTRIFPDYGGPAKQAYLQSQFCSKNNFKVTNIACIPKNKSYIKKENVNQNFEVIYLPFHAPGGEAKIWILFLFFIKFFIFSLIEIIKIIRKEKVDIIHAHTPLPSGFVAYIACKMFNIPYFYTIHGLDIPTPFLLNFDMRFSAQNALKTFVVSKELESQIKSNYNVQNTQILYNSIDLSNFFHVQNISERIELIKKTGLEAYLSKNDFIIVYIGYMFLKQKVKGMIDFLEAFHEFLNKISENERRKVKLLFIGSGEYSYLLENKIDELILNNNVFFIGKRDDVKDILAISNLLALTSYIEGFPNVILEAMASKVPCLGTNVGEIKNIIGDTGFIVSPGNIVEIENNLSECYSLSEEKKGDLTQKTYKRAKQNYDLEVIGRILLEFYKMKH